jgi:uncharacterized protein
MRASGPSTLNKDQIAERGARMARRDDREYREYLKEEQRSQPGCPAREVVLIQRGRATSARATSRGPGLTVGVLAFGSVLALVCSPRHLDIAVRGYDPPGFSRMLVTPLFAAADPVLPELSEPVTDIAGVIDPASKAQLESMIRSLKDTTGDVVVVATVPTVEPFADIREYAVKLFENHGKGIGDRAKDNGALMLLALKERKVWVEVGYGLEEWITDGFAGETSRDYMVPEFRNERYGPGLVAGAARIIGRIAQGRGVTLPGIAVPSEQSRGPIPIPIGALVWLAIIAVIFISRGFGGPRRGMRRWGRPGWSGWSSGVGPFGGGWSGRSGGGFGGGFGGFGGGRSGGGGGGAGW